MASLFGGNSERSGAKPSLDQGNYAPSIGGSLREVASISERGGARRESRDHSNAPSSPSKQSHLRASAPSNAPSSPTKQSHLRGSAPSNAPSSPAKQSHLRGGGVAAATDQILLPLSPPLSSPNPNPDTDQASTEPRVILIEYASYHDGGREGRALVGDLARSAGVPEVMSPKKTTRKNGRVAISARSARRGQ